MNDDLKNFLDFGAIGSAVGSLFDILPKVSSLLAVIWIGIRIYESRTVQSWLTKEKIPHTRGDDHE